MELQTGLVCTLQRNVSKYQYFPERLHEVIIDKNSSLYQELYKLLTFEEADTIYNDEIDNITDITDTDILKDMLHKYQNLYYIFVHDTNNGIEARKEKYQILTRQISSSIKENYCQELFVLESYIELIKYQIEILDV